MRSNRSDFDESARVATPNKPRTNKCKLVKSLKPLVNFRFYLDIEKHHVWLKIETKIRELGGSIEQFSLTKEVTHFITDKTIDNFSSCRISSSQTPAKPQISIASGYADAALETACNEIESPPVIRSRADAMLHRVRKSQGLQDIIRESFTASKSTQKQKSPTQVAKNWGISIWHSEYALKFLEKVCVFIKERYANKNITVLSKSDRHEHRIGNAFTLKGNYIKIEAFDKKYRPHHQVFQGDWPKISLESTGDPGAFKHLNDGKVKTTEKDTRSRSRAFILNTTNATTATTHPDETRSNMTRKNRPRQHVRVKQSRKLTSSDDQCGFCEICHVEYDALGAHLKTDEHINYVKNDANYLNLDTLIKSSANVDDFLKVNRKKAVSNVAHENTKPNRSKRQIFNREAESKKKTDNKMSTLSPKGIEDASYVRQTRRMGASISYKKPSIINLEDEIPDSLFMRSRRESSRIINYAEQHEYEDIASDEIELENFNKKAETAKTRPAKDQSSETHRPKKQHATPLYKVVETRSEAPTTKSEPLTGQKRTQSEQTRENSKHLIVKFRRMRQKELEILSGEAVNFMFPKKIKEESDSTDVDRQSTSDKCQRTSDIMSSDLVKSPTKRKLTPKLKNENTGERDVNVGGKNRKASLLTVQNEQSLPAHSSKRTGGQSNRRFPVAPIQSRGKKSARRRIQGSNRAALVRQQNCPPPDDRMGEDNMEENTAAGCNKRNQQRNKWSNINKFLNESGSRISEHKFSFERVPYAEPWYNVFRRQDEYKEKIFEYYGSTVYRKLPYEMGPLPPMTADCCILNVIERPQFCYETPTKNGIGSEQNLESNECQMSNGTKKSSNENNAEVKPKDSLVTIKNKKKSRLSKILQLEIPRKSPREHASTLAILSCLIRQRKFMRQEKSESAEKSSHSSPVVKSSTSSAQRTWTAGSNSLENQRCDNQVCFNQISENVKRMRRGETLMQRRIQMEEDTAQKLICKSRRPNSRLLNRTNSNLKNSAVKMEKKFYDANKDDYVDVNRLQSEIDNFLTSNILNPCRVGEKIDEENDSIAFEAKPNYLDLSFYNDVKLSDFIVNDEVETQSQASESCVSMDRVSKLRLYKMFSANNNKKRVNRTGWPKIKRRVVTRQQNQKNRLPEIAGLSDIIKIEPEDEAEEMSEQQESPITPPETDPEETKTGCDYLLLVNGRDENTNISNISTSAKFGDNSDVFTVSSDSLDVEIDTAESGVNSQRSKTPIDLNGKPLGPVTGENFNSYPSIAKAVSVRSKLKTSMGAGRAVVKTKNLPITKVKVNLTRVSLTRQTGQVQNNTRSTIILATPKTNEINSCLAARQKPAMKIKSAQSTVSPRKLRKPRGRWYRER